MTTTNYYACPKCGSTDLIDMLRLGIVQVIVICEQCGYQGTPIVNYSGKRAEQEVHAQ